MTTPLLRSPLGAVSLAVAIAAAAVAATQGVRRFDPVVELLAAHQPVFGAYAPSNPRGRGGRGQAVGTVQPQASLPAPKTPAELARQAVDYTGADFVFDGSMEGPRTFDSAYARFADFAKGIADAKPVAG